MSEGGDVYRPSNGSEGEWFMEKWCARCRLDEMNGGTCDRVMRSMAYDTNHIEYPREWRYRIGEKGLDAWCTAYVPKGTGGGGSDGERRAA